MLKMMVIVVGSSPVLERTVHDLIIWKLLTRRAGERKTQMALFVNDRGAVNASTEDNLAH